MGAQRGRSREEKNQKADEANHTELKSEREGRRPSRQDPVGRCELRGKSLSGAKALGPDVAQVAGGI